MSEDPELEFSKSADLNGSPGTLRFAISSWLLKSLARDQVNSRPNPDRLRIYDAEGARNGTLPVEPREEE
jgi:hypothetical protein